MEKLLPRIATEAGNLEEAAKVLRVTTTTISNWAQQIGMRRICYYVVESTPPEPTGSE